MSLSKALARQCVEAANRGFGAVTILGPVSQRDKIVCEMLGMSVKYIKFDFEASRTTRKGRSTTDYSMYPFVVEYFNGKSTISWSEEDPLEMETPYASSPVNDSEY